jgi:ribulose-phosphate 3-epimerase
MSLLIAPSLLSANFSNLKDDVEMINQSEADWFHLDIMDGVFVPNISFGLPILHSIRALATKPFDVHLMIVQPERYIKEFKAAGADIYNVHYEACTHLHRTVEAIRHEGMQPGVTLNPHSPVHLLEEIITEVDLVLLMSVNPGFGGQSFIQSTYQKVEKLKELILRKNSKALIQVDGGVDDKTTPGLVNAGADVLVSGSYIFKSADPKATISKLKSAGKK